MHAEPPADPPPPAAADVPADRPDADRGPADRPTPARVRRPAEGGPELGPEVAAPPADDPGPEPADPRALPPAAAAGEPRARRGADPRFDPDPRRPPSPPRPKAPPEPAGDAGSDPGSDTDRNSSAGPAGPLFDRAVALARLGGAADLLGELAAMYAEDAPALCDAFEAALARGDAEEARRSAHSLKGVSATVAGDPAKRAAHAAEVAAAAHLDAALAAGRDPAKLPPAELADLEAPGAAMRAASAALAAALTEAFAS